MTAPTSILLRAPNWLGDCVMALPALERLREAFPDAQIAVACRAHLTACFEAAPGANEVIPCPGHGGLKTLFALWRHGSSLRERAFDTGILLTNSASTAFWLWRTGTKRRIGFNRDGRGMFLTDRVPVTPALAAAHQSDYYLHLCNIAGASATPSQPRLVVSDAGRIEADAVLKTHGLQNAPFCVIAPVSAYGAVKDWPTERFAAIAKRIADERNTPVLVTGVAAHREACGKIAKDGGAHVFNVAGDTGMAGFLGLIERAALFVGNDSGGAHAAAACNVPTVVLFGITEPSRTKPLGTNIVILGEGGEATPNLKDPRVRAAAKQALSNITVDHVWTAVQSLTPAPVSSQEATT